MNTFAESLKSRIDDSVSKWSQRGKGTECHGLMFDIGCRLIVVRRKMHNQEYRLKCSYDKFLLCILSDPLGV
jgi:hypothetical protein